MSTVVNGILLRDQQVLMALRSPTRGRYANSWSFPGGHVEPGETLDQALQRELGEEIGVTPTKWTFLSKFTEAPTTFHLFAVHRWTGTPANLAQEHSELRWMPLAKAARLPALTFCIYADVLGGLKG